MRVTRAPSEHPSVCASALSSALFLATGLLVACGPLPAARLRLSVEPKAVAFAYGGRVAVTEEGYRVHLLAPDLSRTERTLVWKHDPGDGSVDFGRSIAVGVDGTFIAAGGLLPTYLGAGGEGRITVWRVDGVLVRELRAHGMLSLGRLRFLPDGRLAALVQLPVPGRPSDFTSALYVWQPRGADTTPERWSFPDVSIFHDFDVDATGGRLALMGSDGPYVATPGSVRSVGPLAAASPGRSIAIHPGGSVVVSATRKPGIGAFLLDAGLGSPGRALGGEEPQRIAFDPAGERVAMLRIGAGVRVLDVASGEPVLTTNRAVDFAWRPDGRAIVTLGMRGEVSRWAVP